MKRNAKIMMVAGGYVLAFVAAAAASWLYDVRMSQMPYDTSGGMYAGGEAMTGIAVFLVAAVAPTVLAMWFLRKNVTAWWAIGIVSLGFAVLGLTGILLPTIVPEPYSNVPLTLLSLFGVSQLLGMPFWTLGLTLSAFLAPSKPTRRLLIVAIGVELVIGVCAAIHWFVPQSRI